MLQTILNNIKNNNDNLYINLVTSYKKNNGKEILNILPKIKKPFSIIISCNTFDSNDIQKLVEILPKIQAPFSMHLGGNDLQHKVEIILESLTQVTVPFDVDFTCNNIPISTFQNSEYFLSRMQASFEMSFAYNAIENQDVKYITNAFPTIKVPFKLKFTGNDFDTTGANDIASAMLNANAPCEITTVKDNSDTEFPSILNAHKNNIATMDSKKFFSEIVKKNNLPYILLPPQYEELFNEIPLEIQEILCSYFGFENIHNKYLSLIHNKNAIQDNRVETLQYDKLDLTREKFNNDNTELKSDPEEIHINENSIKSKYSLQQKIYIIDNSISITRTCIDRYIHEKSLVTNPDLLSYITSLAVIVNPTPFTISTALILQLIYSNDDLSIPLSSIATIIELEITKIISKSVSQMPFQGSLIGHGYILYATACATLKMLDNGYDLITNDLVHLYNHLFFVDESSYSQDINDNFDNYIDDTCNVYDQCTEHIDTHIVA